MYIYSIAKENIMEFLSDLESLVREHFKEERFEDEQLKRINKIFVSAWHFANRPLLDRLFFFMSHAIFLHMPVCVSTLLSVSVSRQ